MNVLDLWNHKWFGVWREYGLPYERCPSVHEFVDPEVASRYDKARLREYLTSAQIIASTSRRCFPCPFTGQRSEGSISFRTDGTWLWLDDLPEYIERFDVALPSTWLRSIQALNYKPPSPVAPEVIEKLERPPIGGVA